MLCTAHRIKSTWLQSLFHPNQQRILLAPCNIKHFCIGLPRAYHLSIFIYVHINRTALSTGHIFPPTALTASHAVSITWPMHHISAERRYISSGVRLRGSLQWAESPERIHSCLRGNTKVSCTGEQPTLRGTTSLIKELFRASASRDIKSRRRAGFLNSTS